MGEKFDGGIGGNSTVGRGSDELAEIFGTTVAGSEEAREISRAGIIGNYETRLIKEKEAFEIAIFEDFSEGRKTTDFDEEAGDGQNLLIF